MTTWQTKVLRMMSTSMNRSPERLVYFSDAVVAIALTLLVLPLAEAVPEAVSKHADSLKVITENQWKIYSFLLSFAVIARLWSGITVCSNRSRPTVIR
jgi:uncharacterized membrane protein